jgi:hypothetical protein
VSWVEHEKENDMKRNFKWIAMFIMAVVLAACSPAGAPTGPANPPVGGETGSQLLTADYENALPVELQLAYGILSLDGTENEVDAQTAAQLLPLWKAVRSLSGSDTVAAEEIRALFKQIQETMTPVQIQAIAAMQLTREDMPQIAEKLGLQFGPGGGRFENMSPEMQATMEAARESGQAPSGGPGGGGFIPGAGPGGGGGFVPGPGEGGFGQGGGSSGQVDPEVQATAEARRTQRAGTDPGIPSPVLDAVINYLEGKF